MKETIQPWLEQRSRLPGVLACGVRFPDRICLSQTNAKAYPLESLERTWHQLAEVLNALSQHRVAATRLLWTFEEAQLHYTVRTDGISFGLFTPANVGATDPVAIEKLIEDFLKLE